MCSLPHFEQKCFLHSWHLKGFNAPEGKIGLLLNSNSGIRIMTLGGYDEKKVSIPILRAA